MSRSLCVLLMGMFCVVEVWAQGQPMQTSPRQPQRRPGAQAQGPQGPAKLRWICKQLKLDDQQMQQAEALIAVYDAEMEEARQNPLELMQRIRDKAAEIEAARQEGDMARAQALQEELRGMAPGAQAENNFFEMLNQYLTAEQKQRLPRVRNMAANVGDISLRPIHVLRAAQRRGLTVEQRKQIEDVLAQFRTEQMRSRRTTKEDTAAAVENLIQQVRAVLTDKQAQVFDAEIEELRVGAPPPSRVVPTDTTAGEPGPQEQ